MEPVDHPIRIAPSLLAADFARLGDEIRSVEDGGADWLHVDVMDGHFVPNLTVGPPIVASIGRVARLPLDVHLMIEDPWRYADAFVEAGAAILSFHLEVARVRPDDTTALLRRLRSAGIRTGLALNPDQDIRGLDPFLADLDLVLVMSVFAGFGGQRFLPEVLDKVAVLRAMGFRGEVEMDGGIGPETVGQASSAGVNVFVAGTAVFGAVDRAARIEDLRNRALAART
jgi:ribulose-phosphate 3-epimerase